MSEPRVSRVTIFLRETDQWHHRPLYSEIVHRAHQAGLAGASVFRGIEGFGRSAHIHTSRILSLSEDLPVCVIVVDEADRVRPFAHEIADLTADVVVLLEDVEVVTPSGGAEPPPFAPGRQDAGDR